MVWAVNSYDSILRVYHSSDDLSLDSMRLIHAMTGARNAHYPVKSSFCLLKSRSRRDLDRSVSLLLASGSIDSHALLYYVSPEANADDNSSIKLRTSHHLTPESLAQTLKGHR